MENKELDRLSYDIRPQHGQQLPLFRYQNTHRSRISLMALLQFSKAHKPRCLTTKLKPLSKKFFTELEAEQQAQAAVAAEANAAAGKQFLEEKR